MLATPLQIGLRHTEVESQDPSRRTSEGAIFENEDFDAPDEMPELVTDVSDDEAERPPADSDEPLAKAETTPVPARAPVTGTDTRGLGLETFEGRGPTGAVRVRRGSTRAPHISPE